jgi:hypothetical protein
MRSICGALTALAVTAAVAHGDEVTQPYDIGAMKNAMAAGLGAILSKYPGATDKSTHDLTKIQAKVFTYAYEGKAPR